MRITQTILPATLLLAMAAFATTPVSAPDPEQGEVTRVETQWYKLS